MNSKKDSPNIEKFSEETVEDDLASIDEFFRELEAKEKDLHISSEMVIEIEDADDNEPEIPEFLKQEVSIDKYEIHKYVPPNDYAPKNDSTAQLENKISSLQDKIAKMESERAELFENARRRNADFDNYKKRTDRERSETFRNLLGNVANQMLPVLDNLERALNAASNLKSEKAQEFEQFYEGIVMVSQQLNEILSEMGVEPIVSIGKSFDPHFHEAVATEETDEYSPHTIIEELLRGYRIGEKVIRPSMVKVSSAVK